MTTEAWGKVGTNGNLSDAVTGGISPQQNYSRQSVGNPSSLQEADAKQNKGEHNTYHSIWQEDKHNSLTVLMPMVTRLTATITAINRHTETNGPPYREIIPKDD